MTNATAIISYIDNILKIESILSIIAIIIGAIIVIKIGESVLTHLEKRYEINLTAHYLLKDIWKWLVIIIAITWILQLIGINIQNIIISLGIVGIAIGFASKDIVSNFISGIFVITDKNIEVGNVLEVNNTKGTITRVGFRNTYLINQDRHEITVPNSVLSTNLYKIYRQKEEYRIKISATLPNDTDLLSFEERLNKKIMKYDWIDKTKPLLLTASELTKDGPKVDINFWTNSFKALDSGKLIILDEIDKIVIEDRNKL